MINANVIVLCNTWCKSHVHTHALSHELFPISNVSKFIISPPIELELTMTEWKFEKLIYVDVR